MTVNLSLYIMILFLITVVISTPISLVSASPSATPIVNSSVYNISNFYSSNSFQSSPHPLAQKENNDSTSTFEITDQIKALIDERID